jgi:hypothetical protein
MPRMNGADEKALEKWTRLFDEAEAKYNAATTDAEKDKWYERRANAATCIAGIGERANARRNTIDRHKSHKKVVEYDPANDPEPEHHKDCGLNCARGCEWNAWDDRRIAHGLKKVVAPVVHTAAPKVEAPAPKKIELPKSVPVVAAPVRVSRPVPSVIREPREGHSGFFFKEVFWNLPIMERNAKAQRIGRDAALKNEWDTIVEGMRAPREILPPQKAVVMVIERPPMRDPREVFATGQVQTVDEARAAFAPTMQSATGPVTRELDKRVGMPDMKPEELTPSR